MANIQWNDRLAACLPPLTDEQQQGLEADILREGCLSPLFVWNGILVDGHQRYRICRKHGIPFEVRHLQFDSLDQARFWTLRHHKNRRNVSLYTLAECVLQLESEIAARAKANQRHHKGGQWGASGNIGKLVPIETRKELAKEAGVSHDTIARVKCLRDCANEETKQRLRDGRITINAAYTRLRHEQKERERETRRAENAQRISDTTSLDDLQKAHARFTTIVIDPPWERSDCCQSGRAPSPYGSMPLLELLALPVGRLADADCHLYLWITNNTLPKGFALLDRWGFRYVTTLTWCQPIGGVSNHFRCSTEHVLFGVRGTQPLKRRDVGTWFTAEPGPWSDRFRPVEFYDLVESCSPGPYLEMFARSQRRDWVSCQMDAMAVGAAT